MPSEKSPNWSSRVGNCHWCITGLGDQYKLENKQRALGDQIVLVTVKWKRTETEHKILKGGVTFRLPVYCPLGAALVPAAILDFFRMQWPKSPRFHRYFTGHFPD